MKLSKFLFLICYLCSCALIAQDDPSFGAYGLYPVGSTRTLAMGGAFVGLADDASAIFLNPAGLAKTKNNFIADDSYYNRSEERRSLGYEVTENLFRSFVLDMYLHITTGLNTSEETFISYTEAETTQFVTEMQKIQLGTEQTGGYCS